MISQVISISWFLPIGFLIYVVNILMPVVAIILMVNA